MLSILTTILGVVAKGKAAKAIAGGLAGAVLNGSGPLIEVFSKGVVAGAGPQIEQLGYALGSVVVGYVVGWITVWIAPANKPAT